MLAIRSLVLGGLLSVWQYGEFHYSSEVVKRKNNNQLGVCVDINL